MAVKMRWLLPNGFRNTLDLAIWKTNVVLCPFEWNQYILMAIQKGSAFQWLFGRDLARQSKGLSGAFFLPCPI